jgi:imidazolonepropionase-like amidohydrolase
MKRLSSTGVFSAMLARLLLLVSLLFAAPAAAQTVVVHAGRPIADASQPGCSADPIAVAGDPLRDIRLLEHVDYVMARGKEAP